MTTDVRDSVRWAAAAGVTTLVWYAMPDFVRSRRWRCVLKTALLAGGGAGTVQAMRTGDLDPATWLSDQVWSTGDAIGAGLGVVAVAALSVAAEKGIFAFGERRRARGVRFAHTVPALGWAVLAAGAVAAAMGERKPSG